MSELDILRRFLMSGLSLVNKAGMVDAQIARLAAIAGVSLEIPELPGAEVTAALRDHIIEAKKQFPDDTEWLCPNGPRDQICVRYGISRNQIAGVLASATKREQNGNGNGGSHKDEPAVSKTPVPFSPAAHVVTRKPGRPHKASRLDASGTSSAPTTRHPRNPTPSQQSTSVPASYSGVTANSKTWPTRTKRALPYPVDDLDRHIARLVIESGSWELFKKEIAVARCLSVMQVAGLKAAYTSARMASKK